MQNSFTVLPMSQRFSLEPGKTYEGKISVSNPVDATGDFSYIVSVTPYSVVGVDYTADLATATNRTQIADWITIKEPTGKIAPNEVRDVEFTITVPKNAPAGGQYATIAVTSNPDAASSDGVNVGTVFELASVIYASVSGRTIHNGDILENNVPGFSTVTPVEVSALLSNNGNVHEDATFTLSVKNNFTGDVIFPSSDDTNNGSYTELVMPESTRLVNREISGLPSVGVVHISQAIYYNGDYSIVEKDVIICPLWLLFMIIAVIGGTIGVMLFKIRAKRNLKAAS